MRLSLVLTHIRVLVAELQLSKKNFTKACDFCSMTLFRHAGAFIAGVAPIQSRPAKNSFILAKKPSCSGLPLA
jgi:hypothetical protein